MKALAVVLTVLVLFSQSLPARTARPPKVENLQLVGNLSEGRARFILTATAQVDDTHSGSLVVLTGPVALADTKPEKKWHIETRDGQFVIFFEATGKVPFRVEFEAKVRLAEGWNAVEFGTVASPLQPIRLQGLPEDTKLLLADAARPERHGSEFTSFLA